MTLVYQLFSILGSASNWTVADILTVFSLILVIIGGVFAYSQWLASTKTARAELIKEILERLRFDKEMTEAMYFIDYNPDWYSADFHTPNNELEYKIDKLLSYLSYICYLRCNKEISNKEFQILQYEVNRTCLSHSVQCYLWNLYHFLQKEDTACCYQYLIDYGIHNNLIDPSFYHSDCTLYDRILYL